MRKLRKRVFGCAPAHTVYLGPGRKEFHPKKPRPGIEHYVLEAGRASLNQVANPDAIDQGVIGNFMASRFNRQGHLNALLPEVHEALLHKPCTRVEGACGSGGLAVSTGLTAVLSDLADAVLVIGVEVQNSVKAIYGADILAGAGHYSRERKEGHVFFFPNLFSDRAGAYYDKYGRDDARRGMAEWYALSVENARRNPNAQEHHNSDPDPRATGMTEPNEKFFLKHINVYDCSKVTDGASALILASEEGLKKLGVPMDKAAEFVGVGHCEGNLAQDPPDLTRLDTTAAAGKAALESAGAKPSEIGLLEVHDCFTITGLLSLEAIGLAKPGKGAAFLLDGKTQADGECPTNPTGGLCGFGHPTGATGVRQAGDMVLQLTGGAGDCQVKFTDKKPYTMSMNMGGNDKTLVSFVMRASS
ncbi:MAG: thiolase C-terminal domain-containing protein [Planctomycetota bacterium]|jgi:acetyl-CoA C-acetyltransferase/acetyl-CoA acyltransferase